MCLCVWGVGGGTGMKMKEMETGEEMVTELWFDLVWDKIKLQGLQIVERHLYLCVCV